MQVLTIEPEPCRLLAAAAIGAHGGALAALAPVLPGVGWAVAAAILAASCLSTLRRHVLRSHPDAVVRIVRAPGGRWLGVTRRGRREILEVASAISGRSLTVVCWRGRRPALVLGPGAIDGPTRSRLHFCLALEDGRRGAPAPGIGRTRAGPET